MVVFNVHGQNPDFEFDHFSTNEGLSNGYVTSILQDNRGFVWIGTLNGLNRFDGLSFKNYLFDSRDSTSISSTAITSLIEDSLHNLWIMTSHFFCLYNANTDNFSRKTLKHDDVRFDYPYISGAFIDSRGYMWLGSFGIIYRFKIYDNPKLAGPFIEADTFLLNEPDMGQANLTSVGSFIEDEKGVIWICSYSNNLFYFDEKQKSFIAYPIDHPDRKHFTNTHKSMIQDRDGNFFITIDWNGLLVWYRDENRFKLYKSDGTDNNPNDNLLFGLFEHNDGTIWVGGRDNGGINIFDKRTEKFSYCLHDESNVYSLNTNKIGVIYQDNSGTFWIGGVNGVNKYSPGGKKFRRYFRNNRPDGLSLNNVLCFAENKDGNIWVGTDGGGLNLMNRKTGKFTRYMNEPGNNESLSSNTIISLCKASDGMLYLGTFNGGLSVWDGRRFKAYMPDPDDPCSISSQHIWYVFEDSKRNLWVATLQDGLDILDRKTGRFYNYLHKFRDSTSLVNNSIVSMFEDSRQNLFIAAYDGVSVIDLKQYDFSRLPQPIKFRNLLHDPENPNSLSSTGVFCVIEDKQHNLWFGTMAGGLDKYDPRTGEFTNYSDKEGLPGNAVSSILIDDENILWLATNKGLARFNPDTKEIRVFDQSDGLQNSNFHGLAYKAKDGEMFFCGLDGFNSFYPDKIKYNTTRPPVIITGLRIFNRTVHVNEKINNRIVLPNDISVLKELVLTYREDFFEIEFVALDYTLPVKNQYAYMMEGFDRDWIYCGSRREASYTNLNPGEYIFRVKASNNDGYWNEEGTSLEITILSAWWNTLLFKVLLIVVAVMIVLSVYRMRISMLNRQKHILENTVAKRTEELSGAVALLEEKQEEITIQNEELQRHRNELEKLVDERTIELKTAKERAEESDRLKSAFLANMSHEIRTPMNAIVGFAELLNDDDVSAHERDSFIKTIKNNSDSLLALINDILDISIIEVNQLVLHKEKFCVDDILLELRTYYDLKNNKNLYIHYANHDLSKRKTYLYNDPVRFRQIMTNLINNAYKYTDHGYIKFGYIREKDFIRFYVEDTGIGISVENQDKVFNYFNKIEPNTDKFYQGTGIGLAICKKLVEMMDGEISVTSELNKGSVFSFTLPVSVSEQMPDQRAIPAQPERTLQFSTILVAEDEVDNFYLMERLLKKTGAEIVWAQDGEEAVRYIREKGRYKKCLVLMDIKMPRMNGYEAAEQIKAMDKNIPVIAVTAYAQEDDKIRILQKGFDDYIAKPIDKDKLYWVIASYPTKS
ncbi:MAG: response regulator [Bacteroidales bacterium]|nr:response regulator [Bacteroidales bacterium]